MSKDPNSMLLDMMSPDQARLLDQQLRQKQLQQGVTNYGSDPLGRFLTSASGAQRASQGFGMLGQRLLTGERLKGAEELKAERQQALIEQEKQRLAQEKAKEEANETRQRQAAIIAAQKNPNLPPEVKQSLIIGIASGDENAMEQAYKYDPKSRYVSVGGSAFIDMLDPERKVQRPPTQEKTESDKPENDLEKIVGFDIDNTTFESQVEARNLVYTMRQSDKNHTEAEIAKAARDTLKIKPATESDNQPSVYTMKQADAAETASNEMFFQSQNYLRLYQDVLNTPLSDGIWSRIEESLKATFGAGDRETLIKKLIGSATIVEGLKLLPPGSASNVEYTNSLAQVPNKDDDREVILGWLDNVTRLTSLGADFQAFKANYILDPKNKGMSVGAGKAFVEQLKKNNPEKYDYYFNLEGSTITTDSLKGTSTADLIDKLNGMPL